MYIITCLNHIITHFTTCSFTKTVHYRLMVIFPKEFYYHHESVKSIHTPPDIRFCLITDSWKALLTRHPVLMAMQPVLENATSFSSGCDKRQEKFAFVERDYHKTNTFYHKCEFHHTLTLHCHKMNKSNTEKSEIKWNTMLRVLLKIINGPYFVVTNVMASHV